MHNYAALTAKSKGRNPSRRIHFTPKDDPMQAMVRKKTFFMGHRPKRMTGHGRFSETEYSAIREPKDSSVVRADKTTGKCLTSVL